MYTILEEKFNLIVNIDAKTGSDQISTNISGFDNILKIRSESDQTPGPGSATLVLILVVGSILLQAMPPVLPSLYTGSVCFNIRTSESWNMIRIRKTCHFEVRHTTVTLWDIYIYIYIYVFSLIPL